MKITKGAKILLLLAVVVSAGIFLKVCSGTENYDMCSHKCDENCYIIVTTCIHSLGHDELCGYAADEDGIEITPCTHVCSVQSGCVYKDLDCRHEHGVKCLRFFPLY